MGVRFLLDGEVIALDAIDPTMTVLDLLRYRLRRTGSKEGCAEGDCGACTVLVGELSKPRHSGESRDPGLQAAALEALDPDFRQDDGGGVIWRAVNACILFVPMLDGRALKTVESVGRPGALHPVQREMVSAHGSQCGFCTPGFVMSLYGRSIGAVGSELPVADVIAGNLCRCTGYGPILAAGEAVPVGVADDEATVAALAGLRRDTPLDVSFADPLSGITRRWIAPRTIEQLAEVLVAEPEARIVSGATDVGLWVTKQQRVLPTIVWTGDVAGFADVGAVDGGLTIGAGARYADVHGILADHHPELGELVRRIGGLQVRNSGTIGGNIANGSPIGDMPPALIALGATLVLRRGGEVREMPLEDYFLDYGRQDRRPGEFVAAVRLPAPPSLYRVAKLSKRFDSDISAVCGAFGLEIERGVVRSARIAFGGMAATPKRARAAEAALVGRPWCAATVEAAARALAEDYAPLSDVRGSSAYRLAAAANVLRRLWVESETPGEALSVLGLADA